jgi:hypothetical protein
MTRAVLVLLLALSLLPAFAADQAAPPREMVVLTVVGAIDNTNRGRLDPERDSFLAHQGIGFARAFAFDRAMLAGLKQGTVRAPPPELRQPATFTGPLLKEVLAAVGASRAKVTLGLLNTPANGDKPDPTQQAHWIWAVYYIKVGD